MLESSFILYQLQPYHKNFNKRLIKSPKLYFYDTGVACSLLRLTSPEMVNTHYLYGALFENLVISEIIKYQNHSGKKHSVYYWRESNGIEIDCIIEKENNRIIAVEIKGGQTFTKDYMKNLRNFQSNDNSTQKKIIYRGDENTILADVQLIGWNEFDTFLNGVV